MASAIRQALQSFSQIPQQLAAIPKWIGETKMAKQNFLPKEGYAFYGPNQSGQIDKKLLYGENWQPKPRQVVAGESAVRPTPLPAPQASIKPRQSPVASPLPVPTGSGSKPWGKSIDPSQELIQNINGGYEKYKTNQNVTGRLPAMDYAPVFAEYAERYPLFKDNPYLMPAVAIAETSGGLNMTRPKVAPKDLINYGANSPKIQQVFSNPNIDTEEALRRALYEMATGTVYPRYAVGRQMNNSELQDFAKTYEPANDEYYNYLTQLLNDYWGQNY